MKTPYPCNTGCFVCDWFRAMWNATGLGAEPIRCSQHRVAPPGQPRAPKEQQR